MRLVLLLMLLAAPAAAQERPKALVPLYAGQIALQAFDLYSTRRAIELGAVEKNRHADYALQSGTFAAVKVGISAATIATAEVLWRRGRRRDAVLLMIISNGVMVGVAANNAHVLHRLENGQ